MGAFMDNPIDYLAIEDAWHDLNTAWLKDMHGLMDHCHRLNMSMSKTSKTVLERLNSVTSEKQDNGWDLLMNWVQYVAYSGNLYHQVFGQWMRDIIDDAPTMEADSRKRALFWVQRFQEMSSPANCFWSNPRAVRRMLDSKGSSVMTGMHNWLADLRRDDGMVGMTDTAAFTVGQNLALTPGHVVFRNDLLEVIQYSPQGEAVWQVPVVMIQPWINKYYIFDLQAHNSFVRYLVANGFTVFVTSWKNPSPEMRHVTFEDYMLEGALQAIRVAQDISGSDRVHAAGYCIGGTLLATLAAWLANDSNASPLADVTLFATLLDFANPGDLGVFTHPKCLKAIEKQTAQEGLLDANSIARTFRLLNAGELIWRHMVNSYFLGEMPPRSEILFWNSDSTSLPQAMCAFYLKAFYHENRLARPNGLVLGGRAIDLRRIRLPIYAVGAEKDHICPWQSTFQTCRLTKGPVRYVLAGDGHITGIVNPPSVWSKKKYRAGPASRRRNPVKWLTGRIPQTGSWWPDWIAWMRQRSGFHVSPPQAGSARFPALEPAPGTYVHE
jgi:polyhydroxyalkanoate synthase